MGIEYWSLNYVVATKKMRCGWSTLEPQLRCCDKKDALRVGVCLVLEVLWEDYGRVCGFLSVLECPGVSQVGRGQYGFPTE